MARSFNGSSDQIATATYALPTAGTLSAWVNASASISGGPTPYIGVICHSGGTGNFQILLKNTGKVAYYVAASGTVSVDPGSTTFPLGWMHMALTYDSVGGLKAYINGVSDGTAAANGTINAGTSPIMGIGYDPLNAGRNIPGSIADCAEWSTNLSSGQITQLFNGVRPVNVNSANLIGWWPLDGYASPETDLAASPHNGTLTGTAQVLGPPALWRISA